MSTATLTGFALSPQQQRLWRLHGPGGAPGFVVQGSIEIAGALDRDRLWSALDRVVERHEVLRTTFPVLPGMTLPVQAVGENGAVARSEHRLEGGSELHALLRTERSAPFDLAAGPLLRASLAETGPGRHHLLLTLPAVAADAASIRALAAEIAATYAGEDQDEPLQYVDASGIFEEWLGPLEGEEGAAWWRRQDLSALSRLVRRSGELPAIAPFAPRTVPARLGPDEAGAMLRLAEQMRLPPAAVALAAWAAALWQTTGEEVVVIGTGFDGRTCSEFETALGPYTRYLPVPCPLGPGATLAGIADSLQTAMSEAAARQDFFPPELADEALRPGTGGWPFGFDFEPAGALRTADGGAVTFRARPVAAGLDRFELRLSVRQESDGALLCELEHDPAVCGDAAAARLLGRAVRAIAALSAEPHREIADLDPLSTEERAELLSRLDATAAADGAPSTARELFAEPARRSPDAPAVASGGLVRTHAELRRRVLRLAGHLAAQGIGPESRVGVCLERTPGSTRILEALLAVLETGGAYVPLDPGHPAKRLSFLLDDSAASLLLTEERLLPRIPSPLRARILCLDQLDGEGEAGVDLPDFVAPPLDPDHLAYVIYTSGSTGRPKGVMVPHRGLASYLLWAMEAYGVRGGSGAPIHSAVGFDLTVTSLFVPLAAGRSVELLPEEQGVSALAAALRERRGFSLVKLTPAHLDVLRQVQAPEEVAGCARALVIGGEALRAESLELFRQGAPDIRLINEYGPTEATVGCCVYEVGPDDPSSGPVPIGRPIAGTRLYVVGPRLWPLPAGAPGELWIGGAGLARGYLGRPDLTAERFVPDPFGPAGERLYRTGDRVRLRLDGHLEFLGRLDDQVKIRGYRIELGEIEAALASHPQVREAAVVAREEEGGKRLLAYVVPRSQDDRPAVSELRRHLEARLPDFMIPAGFVDLEALPLTPNGKLDRRALPDPGLQEREEVPYVPPRTLAEEVLAGIWSQVLGVDRVGIDDPFFSLGGDSIRSLQVLALAQKRGLSLTLQDLFQRPTIRRLAEVARLDGAEPEPELAPFALISPEERRRLASGIEDAYPLSQLQAGMLFHSEYAPEAAVYHDLHSFRLRARFDRELLESALAAEIRRHPVLRTSFAFDGFGEPLQLVHSEVATPLRVDDLRSLDEPAQRRAIEDFLIEERHLPFTRQEPPLVRFRIHRCTEDTFQLTLSFHHAVLDGWSAASLLTSLFGRYAALLDLAPLPEERPVPTAFRELVALERSAAESPAAREFWRRHLEGAELGRLPRWGAAAAGRDAVADIVVPVPSEVSDGLRRLARAAAVPLKSVLLAAHFRVLSHATGTPDVVTGVVSHGRPEREGAEEVLGLFLNTLPLRLRHAAGTWMELAQATFDLEREVLPFRRFPMAELQRLHGGAPLFEVIFNFLHYHVYLETAGVSEIELLERTGYEETNFPLAAHFQLAPGSPQVELVLSYRPTDLEPGQAEALAGRYQAALSAMAATPGGRCEENPLLTAAERHQLLAEWNDAAADISGASILAWIEEQVDRTPGAVAVVFEGERLTYAELDAAANRLAHRLRSLGVGPESLVAVALDRSCELVVALLGTLKAGAAWLPLDPDDPRKRLEGLLEDSGAHVLLTLERLAADLTPVRARVLCPNDTGLAAESSARPRVPVDGASAAYMIYTSGTTGRPKGVVNTHRGLLNRLLWMQSAYGLTPEDRVLQKTPSTFDVSVWELFWPLMTGARLVVARPGGHREPSYLADSIESEGVTTVHFVPSILQLFLQEPDLGPRCRSLRLVVASGEALGTELQQKFHQTFAAPGPELHNLYGPTEAAIDVTSWACRRSAESARVPIGRPVANTAAHILDAWLQPVPLGAPGELYLGGLQLARGYFGRPALTADRFLPDPVGGTPGGRLYRTGDLARHRPDGAIDYLGRLDFQVKIRGVRLELGEVEAALDRHPAVAQSVAGVHGDGADRRLVAYLLLQPGAAVPGAAKLRAHLQESLPDSMIPSAFVPLAAFPLTPSGKVDRKALPAPEWQSAGEAFLPPRTPVEEVLAGIWAELLGLERVGAADHFFALGGHSLLATRVMSRLRGAFGVEMPLRDLFEAPMLADLATRVEAARLQKDRAGAGRLTPPLAPVPREMPLPLSFAQQRLWFIDQLEPGSPLYNVPVALRVEGPLDPAVLALTLGEIVRRHEPLRTVFAAPQGAPVQVIRPAAPFALHVVDLSGLPEAEREAAARTLAGEEARRPFDLGCGPLLRGLLLRLSPPGEQRGHVVALTMHHIASDGWSMGILVREVAALYPAFAEGRPSPLAELPVQYADFAAWQHSWLHGKVLEEEISFWRRQLAGLPPRLELPTDRPRPVAQSFRGASRPVRLPAGLAAQVQALGRREGATLFMVLLAGFQALLARHSGQDDLAVGTPVAGRNREEVEGLIGFFVNTLVLRGDLTGGPSFRELLGRVRETALAAHTHQDVPFERLVQELTPERSLAHTPLFQVMLSLQNAPAESLEIRDLRLRPFGGAGTTARFDLTLTLEEHRGMLGGSLEYATDLFDAATIDRLIRHFERLLAAAVATPDLSASALPLLSPAELDEVVREALEGSRTVPAEGRCVHELFAEQAARTPGAPAVVDEEGAWTYAQLGRRVRRLALRLRAAGVGPDQPVILCAERGAGLVAGLLGILEAGGAYLAVEPDLPRARQEMLAHDAHVTVAVTERRLADALPDGLIRVFLDSEDPEDPGPPVDDTPRAAVLPGHLAYVLYTSGSTGHPKGVMVEHRQLTAYVQGVLERLAPPPGAGFATVSSFSADLGNTSIFAALLGGGCLHVVSREQLADAGAFAERMERRPVDVLKIVPSHLAALLTAERPERSLPRKLLVLGGAPLPWSLVDRVRTLAPECRLFNHYGPTETTVGVLAGAVLEDALRANPSAPLGRPLGSTRAWVVDRHLQLVPDGLPGELCAGGPQVTRGYLGRPDLTAERFIPDPFGGDAGGRLYRTGDLVRRRPHGPVEFLGRIDSQVKVRGFRIELGEIEAALLSLPGVREAVVLAREDRLVAYVVGVVGDAAADALRQPLRERLPDYMVPAAFVTLAALPLTPNGKVDRKALPAPEWQGAQESYLAPRTPVEEVLAGIWAELLGRERVGAADHFFDLGGHSLLATQVISRLRSTFDVEMPLRSLFEAPRLADLARRVETARLQKDQTGAGRLTPPLVPVPREGPLPLSFAQQRLWFLDQLEPGLPLYNMPVVLRIEGPLDSEVLALCVGEIVRRHEALRTVFAAPDGSPVQVIRPVTPFALPVADLSGLPEGRRRASASNLAGEEARRPFDLTRGPLLRGVLLRLAAGAHVLALTLHHIVSDGWSMGILVREVTTLYAALAEGRRSLLAELPVQYADFSVWQRSWLRGEALEGEIDFWRRQLAGLPPLLDLPTDRPRPAAQSFRGSRHAAALAEELAPAASTLARRLGATPFMVLLAGFAALLARHAGREDVVVGTPVANRNQEEIEGLIGFFVNTLALRVDLSDDPQVAELVARVREMTLEAHLHQDLPFEKLVDELQPERSLAHAPVFQVMLVLDNTPREALELPGLRFERFGVEPQGIAKFDLTVFLSEGPHGLVGLWEYATDLFDAATVVRLARGFELLLAGALARPEGRLSELRLLAEPERHQLLVEWNDAPRPDADAVPVHRMVERQAERTPGAVAVAAAGAVDGGWTYADLDRAANRIARRLRRRGVESGARVGLCIGRSPELVAGILGILKAGAAYVPLDPGYPQERLAWMLEDSGAVALVTRDRLAAGLPEPPAGVLRLDADRGLLDRESPEPLEPLEAGEDLEDLAYVIYTSGSTGRPKGVMVSHRALLAYLGFACAAYASPGAAGSLLHGSISFDLSVTSLFVPLLSGQRLALAPESDDPEALGKALLGERDLAFLKLTPSHARMLGQQLPPEGLAGRSRSLVVGGEALLAEDLAAWRDGAPETVIYNEYGPTEAVVGCCLHAVPAREIGRGALLIGRPIPGARVVLLDRWREAPLGAAGELCVGGPGLARGYLGRPDLTAERFVPDPFGDAFGMGGGRLYRTGDLARWRPQGELEYLGRLDQQVKIRGFRIEPGEIEAALLEHGGVREGAVVARKEGAVQQLVAFYAAGPEPGELQRYLAGRLPAHLVPSAFVPLAALPLTPNGKVDMRALARLDRPGRQESHRVPRTPVEELLAKIWGELLGVERVSLDDNFFALGGDSILSLQVVARAAKAGYRLQPRQIFEHQTLAELAAVAVRGLEVDTEQGPVTGEVPLTPAQSWFLDGDPVDPHHFNQAVMLAVRRPLAPAVAERALAALLAHHDALRLRFARGAEGWRQWNAPPEPGAPAPWLRVDLSALPLSRSLEALEVAAGEAQASLGLAAGPLLRGAWFDGPAGTEPRLLLAVHHLAVDGVSWRVLLEDLDTACRQLGHGEAVSLPPKTTSFRRWAERLAEHARSMPLEPELSWWLAQEEGAPGGAALDVPGGDNLQGSVRRATAALSAEETRALLQEVPAAYRTRIDEVLLTALARTFGGTILVELEGHGREEEAVDEVDLSRTVGWFTSLFPLRIDTGGEADPGAALRTVKELLRALPRRGIGYGLLRYGRGDADVARRLDDLPRPPVSFNYLGQFDQVLSGDAALFVPTGEPAGPVRSPRAARPYALDVSALVSGGRLQVSWAYSRNLHHPDSMQRLSEAFLGHLREIIAHCRAAAERRSGGYTPSDFPLARLGAAELDRLLGAEWGIADVYPLSPLQEGILFQSLYAPRSGAYVEQLVCTLRGGERDAEILEAACRLLVERHPVLRTSFHWEGLDRPLQVVHGEAAVAVERQDWRDLDGDARERRFEELLQADRSQGFDLSRLPVMRWRLLRTAEDRHWFLWSYNHILLDGWSFSMLAGELLACCAALRAGTEPDLPRRRPYRDYIAWLAEQDLTEARELWQRTLAGWTEPTPLVVDRRDGADRGTNRRDLRLGAAGTAALEARARELRVTLNTLVQAAWALLLARYGGRGDVVFGATVAGRPATLPEAESMVGLFINTLPVRVGVEGASRLAPWLQRLQLQQSELRQHEHSPLVQVQEWSEVPRGVPLFESILVFENYPRERSLGQGGSGLEVQAVRTVEQTHYPLTLVVAPGQELSLHAAFDLARFDPATIERLLGHLSTLLGAISTSPESRLDELPLLTAAERLQLLGAWNETRGGEPDGERLHGLFEAWAERAPAAAAVLFEGAAVTYGEAEAAANRLAHRLRALGVGPETRVGLCCGRSPEALIAMLGVLKAGGAWVPLDPESPRERLAAIAADAGISLLLTQERLAPALAGLADRLLLLDAAAEGLSSESAERPACPAGPDNAAYVIYTSGSTGGAKGVVATHRGVVNFTRALAAAVGLGPDDRLLLFAPLSFDASVLQIFPPLSSGAAVVVHPDPRELASHEILALCERSGVTVLDLPAALWRQWVEDLAAQRLPFPASLRAFLTGGESVPVARLRTWAGLAGRPVSFLSSYGPTEATVTSTVFRIRSDQVHALAGEIVPIGRPLAGTRAHVLDRALQPAPCGVPGELFLAGAGLARGYLGRPDLTADAFRPDPFAAAPGNRLYRTGDLAVRTPDGDLQFLGRSDHQVKLRGFRLELGEVEAALLRHPGLREAAVVVREDRPGDRLLAAYVVPREAAEAPSPAELRGFLAERLPPYMVPAAVTLLAEIPVLPSGKLDRAALPAPVQAEMGERVAPRTPVEQLLAGIWSEVLGVEEVGAFDSFFELGGHSLAATRVVSRIREELQIDLELRTLFEAPTVAALAESILADPEQRERVERAAELTVQLSGLSEEEIEAMLAAEDPALTEGDVA